MGSNRGHSSKNKEPASGGRGGADKADDSPKKKYKKSFDSAAMRKKDAEKKPLPKDQLYTVRTQSNDCICFLRDKQRSRSPFWGVALNQLRDESIQEGLGISTMRMEVHETDPHRNWTSEVITKQNNKFTGHAFVFVTFFDQDHEEDNTQEKRKEIGNLPRLLARLLIHGRLTANFSPSR